MANDWQKQERRFELLNAVKTGQPSGAQAVIDAANASGWYLAAQFGPDGP